MVVLEERNRDAIIDDVEDRLWSLYGQIVHTILERANEADLVEKRFFATFNVNGREFIVSAQLDSLSLKNKILTDWKFTTVWKFLLDKPIDPEWVAQLNMQLELLRRNKLDADDLRIVGLLRDWSKNEARNNENYPQKGVRSVPIDMWPRDLTVAFIEERISLHEAAKIELPFCTPEERWAKPDVWAVMKGDRAIKSGLKYRESLAKEMQAVNPGTRIEFRPGQAMRCSLYCSAAPFCEQFKTGVNK